MYGNANLHQASSHTTRASTTATAKTLTLAQTQHWPTHTRATRASYSKYGSELGPFRQYTFKMLTQLHNQLSANNVHKPIETGLAQEWQNFLSNFDYMLGTG